MTAQALSARLLRSWGVSSGITPIARWICTSPNQQRDVNLPNLLCSAALQKSPIQSVLDKLPDKGRNGIFATFSNRRAPAFLCDTHRQPPHD